MTKKRTRTLYIVLALALVFSLALNTGLTAFAQAGPTAEETVCTHEHGEACGYVEGAECDHDCTDAPCGEDGASCVHSCADGTCGYVAATVCGHEHDEDCGGLVALQVEEEDPAAITGIITDFVFPDAVQVEIGTPESDIAFPVEVTANVQPDGEDAEPTTVTVGIGAWNIWFGTYTTSEESMCIYEADRASLTLPDDITLPEDVELPLVRVEVGTFDAGIVPMANETTAADVKTTLDSFGASAGGTVTVNGNTVTFSGGTATISGTNSLTIPAGVTLVIDGGTLNITHSNSTNNSAGIYNNGTITLANGTLKVANTKMRGIQNNGTITVSGGTLDIETASDSTNIGILNNSTAPTGTINITGGAVNIANSAGTGISNTSVSTTDSERGKLNISGGTVSVANTSGTGIRNSGDMTISGSANITVASSGTTGINNYVSTSATSPQLTGKITMLSGTLTIANTAGKGLQNSGNTYNSAILEITGGTFTGGNSPVAGNIELAAGSKVTISTNIFTDGDTLVTTTGEITVGANTAPPSANGLSAGTYQWGGTNFNKPNAVVTSVTAGTTTIVSSGGNSIITVAGTNLAAGITVTAFDGATATTITGTTTGSATSQQVTLAFPTNSSTMDDKVYTIKASLDGGTTWDSATASITVSKTSVSTPTITANPSTLTFGNQTVGTTSTTQDITVTGSNLTADISYNTPPGFTITKAAGWDNRLGGTLQVAFSPTSAQAYTGTITITSGATSQTVSLSGTGTVAATPTITANPSALTFGNQNVGTTSSTQTITVTGSNLTANIMHNNPGGFTITKALGWNDLTGGTLEVSFNPTEAKAYNASIIIFSGAANHTVTLSGTGIAAPAITGVLANPTMITQSGSKDSVITVTGTNLPTGVTVTAFDSNGTATSITGTTDASGNVTLTFPPNGTPDDVVYTIKASLDGGTTLATATATVTVLKNAPTLADPDKDTITKGSNITGSGTQTDPYVVTAGKQFTLTLAGDRQSAPGNVIGDTQYIPESWTINPNGTWPYGGPYTISTSLSSTGTHILTVTYRLYEWDGSDWQSTSTTDTKTAYFQVNAADSGSSSNPADSSTTTAATTGSPQTGDNSNLTLWIFVLAGSLASFTIICFIFFREKKHRITR